VFDADVVALLKAAEVGLEPPTFELPVIAFGEVLSGDATAAFVRRTRMTSEWLLESGLA
jgi:hypothetical protein